MALTGAAARLAKATGKGPPLDDVHIHPVSVARRHAACAAEGAAAARDEARRGGAPGAARHAGHRDNVAGGRGSCLSGDRQAPAQRAGSGLIRNQMEYMAGRNTRVRIVPAKVPPISV